MAKKFLRASVETYGDPVRDQKYQANKMEFDHEKEI